MAHVTLKGTAFTTSGDLPTPGLKAPDFTLTRTDLSDISLLDYRGPRIVLNIFPSVDTPVCSATVRRFNEEISKRDNAIVLCISRDLPFAHARFCETEGLKDVIPLSEMRHRDFGASYGLHLQQGPMAGLLARAVFVLDEVGTIVYQQLVEEITEEPDYQAALAALQTSKGEEVCTISRTAEHARTEDSDEPCDDGRAG